MTIEVSAKKIDDAIKQGLEQLGAKLDQVNVEVLESGGLFRKAKVRLTLEEQEPAKKDDVKQKSSVSEEPQKPAPKKVESQAKPEKPEKTVKPEKPVKPEKQADKEKPAKPVKQEKPQPPAAKEPRTDEDAPVKNDENRKVALEQAVAFVKETVAKMGFDGVETVLNGDTISLTAPAGDDSLLIGRHGETLSALSFLAETLGRAEKHHVNLTVDCNGYRARRADSLTAMAKRRANECVQKNRKIKLEPMERIDRRTVHNALTGDDRVVTASEGKEPYRCVVIFPKRKDQQSKTREVPTEE